MLFTVFFLTPLGLQGKTVIAVVTDILVRLTRGAQEGCDLLQCCSLVSYF